MNTRETSSALTAGMEKHTIYRDLWLIWVIALVLRVGYFVIGASHLGLQDFQHFAPDTQVYLDVARHILSWHPTGDYAILRVGPGYGGMIAAIQYVFGDNLLWPTIANILLGSIAPVFIYLLAYLLIPRRIVALISGLVVAASSTAISLSTSLLTDQPFFTLHLAALVCFAAGFKNGRMRWFVASGLLAGAAVFIRSMSQLFPLVFILIPLIIPFHTRSERLRRLAGSAITAGIVLILILTWSYRNYVKHDIFTFGTNGALTVRSCLGVKAIVDHTEEDDIINLRKRWEAIDGDRTDEYALAYTRAIDRFMDILKTHPGWVLQAYAETVWGNIRAGNYYPARQLPFPSFWRLLQSMQEKWLGIVVYGLALIGFAFLIGDRNYLAAALLGATLFYFTLLAGFSFWQGSRIYFPAEMAWPILAVYAVVRIVDRVRPMTRPAHPGP
jgi:hypothetical protein